MTTDIGDLIRVGHVKVPLGTAEDWVRAYTDEEANRTGSAPYAYPAYDRFAGQTTEPPLLTDGDLLAPVLLNVRLSTAPSTRCNTSGRRSKMVWPTRTSRAR